MPPFDTVCGLLKSLKKLWRVNRVKIKKVHPVYLITAGRKNSIRNARIQFKMPCYRKSHIRLKEVSNSAVRLVTGVSFTPLDCVSVYFFCILVGEGI